jgi:spore coat polysaccharide biosynthesis protein SpsF
LRELFERYPDQIACVITEPEKNTCYGCTCKSSPEKFLNDAIKLTHENGALFILDEMVTGFKTGFPGSISKFNVKPDMATWGKGIANGFSFCALTGIHEVMDLGGITSEGEEKVFLISTTHGGETHTMSAAIATINEFQKNNVIEHNHAIGDQLIALCYQVINNHGLSNHIKISPSNWLIGFSFYDSQKEISNGMRTLVMQEMIKRGVLFQGTFVPCFSHTEEDVIYFAKAFDEVLVIYSQGLENGFESLLIGEPAKPVFRKAL